MDLTTKYMGMKLKNPVVASASPLSQKLDNMRRMEDAGAGAVVMFSLFEEQIRHEDAAVDYFMSYGSESFGEALSYFPRMDDYHVGPDHYLELLRDASGSLDIPVIASLNGVTDEGWINYARKMEEAGASAIELNMFYIPANPAMTGRKVEDLYLDVLQAVKASVQIPVAMKLSPFFSSMANMAAQFDDAGADALVLFNRFYQPDFDLDALEVQTDLVLSTAQEIRLPLLWIAILYGRIRASIGATRGVHSGEEVVKYILAGADVVMTTSALLSNGIEFIGTLLEQTTDWMQRHEYESVRQMKGAMSQRSVSDPTAFERANYIRMLKSYKSAFMR
jgi:dihydroorotate dehydrogenase (fumarate)